VASVSDPVFLVDALPTGTTAVLDGAEGRHAATVRRLTPGELLLLADGAGGLARCEVAAVRRESLDLAVLDVTTVPAPDPRITVVQALPKGDRGELAVEMLTEAGVDTIVPWQATRCVTRWRDARGDKALAKWRSTAREAAKQSRRAWLPEVTALTTTSDVAALLSEADSALVLHEASSVPLSTVDLLVTGDHTHIVLVVGPEGGVAPAEIDTFVQAGAVAVRLGDSVLRTSTAGVAALAVVSSRTGRW
jgi:16S rRNA (uracil1498-N3)-methyltransferase